MKKFILSFMLLTFMLFSIVACASDNSSSESPTEAVTNNQEANNQEATDSPIVTDTPTENTEESVSEENSEENEENNDENEEEQPVEDFVPSEVTITDFDGNSVTVMQNPKRVAIYDYAILDILYNVGFDKTGIEVLVVPSKDTLPEDLSFYKNQSNDTVLSGGSLFYVDWDVLDLVQPDLVILGARSFGMNAAGERLSADDNAKFRSETEERYNQAAFARLSINSRDSNLLVDMERNVTALATIFPDIAPELEAKLEDIKGQIAVISEKAQASGKRALFASTPDQTSVSVFLPSSRFDMLYEEFGFEPATEEAVEWTDQHGFSTRAEYILEINPDVIFLLDRSATVGSGAGAENFINDPIISRSEAGSNGDIYVLTGDSWYTMTGGFTATETMIADIEQYINKLN